MSIQCLPSSLRIQFLAPFEDMTIDKETVAALELVQNTQDRLSKATLLGLLSAGCATRPGRRLVRSCILSPLTCEADINSRLDGVQELLENPHVFTCLEKSLRALSHCDGDKLIQELLKVPLASNDKKKGKDNRTDSSAEAARISQKKINLLLALFQLLSSVTSLEKSLSQTKSAIFRAARECMQDERHGKMCEKIRFTLNDDSIGNHKGALNLRNFRVNAIKPGVKLLLDVARETYLEQMRNVDQLAIQLGEQHHLRSLVAVFSRDGFNLACDRQEWDDLPYHSRDFTNIIIQPRKVTSTCVELQKANDRINSALEDVFVLSEEILDELIGDIRSDIVSRTICACKSTDLTVLIWAVCALPTE